MSSAISRAVMRYSMVRLSPRSNTPRQPRIGVMAKASPGCGEAMASEPKEVRCRGGHFSVEIFANATTWACFAVAFTIHLNGLGKAECLENARELLGHSENDDGNGFPRAKKSHALKIIYLAAGDGNERSLGLELLERRRDRLRILGRTDHPADTVCAKQFAPGLRRLKPRRIDVPVVVRIRGQEWHPQMVQVAHEDQRLARTGLRWKSLIDEFDLAIVRSALPQVIVTR